MDNRPKRRKSKDNPYLLNHDKVNDIYTVSFRDIRNRNQIVTISKKIYDALEYFELRDLSYLNEYDNHIEHSEVYEETLLKRAIKKEISVEEVVERKILYDFLYTVISKLPPIQKRRVIKYYFYDQTFDEIAKEEHCTKRAVKFSVDIAKGKILKEMENLDYTNYV